MKIFGFIPARMKARRFPGKPLKKILGKPMIEHVFKRSSQFRNWSDLRIATCDKEIVNFCNSKKFPVVMTSTKHKRCLDRVHEAASKNKNKIKDDDLVICIQGDEPMLTAAMIKNLIFPFKKSKKIKSTILAMEIINKEQLNNPNIVKIVHDIKGRVLYSSRSPMPYFSNFVKGRKPRRIFGIYAFKWNYLKHFNKLKPSPLEIMESCDTNRICDNGEEMFIAKQKYSSSFPVDTPEDLKKVEKFMRKELKK